jgi:hypothetical protein
MQMKRIVAGATFWSALLLFQSLPAAADTIETIDFTYQDPTAGNLIASVNLEYDATTGQALSATGTINSSLFVESNGVTPLGAQSMFLVTATSPLIINSSPAGGGFLWQDSDGTNIQADTAFSPLFPYVDSLGLSFAVGTPTSNGHYASFNFYYEGGQFDSEFLGHGGPPDMGQVYFTGSEGTVTFVPLPAAAWLMLSGLAGLGTLLRRSPRNERYA